MLNAFATRERGRGVAVVGIALDERDAVTGFVARLGTGYPIWFDRDDTLTLMRELGNARGVLPFTVVLDRNGRPVARLTGTIDDAALRAAVRAAG